MKEYFYQYDEIGRPLFFFEFVSDFNYNFYSTSFISDESLNHFERALTYAMDCTVEGKLACKKTFIQLMELDSRRYLYYTSPLQRDFISSRYFNKRNLNLEQFKSDLQIIKKLQNNMLVNDFEYVNCLLSNMLNDIQLRKFELLMNTTLNDISRQEFVHRMDDFKQLDFKNDNQFYVCCIGLYQLLISVSQKHQYSCLVKQVKFEL